MRARLLILTILTALMAAGCGGSPTAQQEPEEKADTGTGFEQVLGEIEGLSGQERTDKLVALAEEEGGTVNLYTSLTSDVADEIGGGFEDAYDIEVALYRADSETVLRRLSEEAKAGFRGADIVETNGSELFNLNGEGVLAPYESDLQDGLVEGSVYEGWTADRFNKFVVSWNTKEVPEGSQPKSWEDLADPKWDGALSLELGDVEWYKTLFEYWVEEGKTEEEAQKIFEDMAKGGLLIRGHTVMGELLSAGEFSIAASNYSYIVQNAIDDGAPVAWEPFVEPIISRPNGVALVNRAQHPASALLFVDWMLTDGQEILADFNLDVAREDLASAQGANEIFVDLPSLIAEQEEWTDRYEQLTALGKQVED